MITYSRQVNEFVTEISKIVKEHSHLTTAEVVGGLELLAAMLKARAHGARITVQIVNIDGDQIDPADAWKFPS